MNIEPDDIFNTDLFPGLAFSHTRQQRLVDLLLNHQGNDVICKVSPYQLAAEMEISEVLVKNNKPITQMLKLH